VLLTTYKDLQAEFVKHPGETLELVVNRLADAKAASSEDKLEDAERHHATVSLAAQPIRDLGLVMKFGPITAVQPKSPAAEAGLQAGDEIIRVTEGADVLSADPLFMPELLRRRAGKMVKVLVMREGKQVPLEVKLREVDWSEEPTGISDSDGNMTDEPMSAPALGIAYDVLNEIESVSGPAEAAGLQKGQKLTKVKFWARGPRKSANEEGQPKEITLPLGPDKRHWPAIFFAYLQRLAPDTKVELYPSGTVTLGSTTATFTDAEKPVAITPIERSDWFRAERGLRLEPLMDVRVAQSLGEAMRLGAQETGDSMSMVVTFLRRIRQLGSKAAGPLGILQIAAGSLEMGFSTFLLILAMLSANLAVVNILPIPVLDGGHLMFLAYEGIRRKPPSEKVMIGLNFLGLALILTVMVLVFSLDIGRWFRG
jgi:regulator of sigma E protease